MALSVGARKGKKIRVGGTTGSVVLVDEVYAPNRVRLSVDDKTFLVTDAERTEILPQVFVSCGFDDKGKAGNQYTRLAFEAPRSIRIERFCDE